MKKITAMILTFILAIMISACQDKKETYDLKVIKLEEEKAFQFFWETSNTNLNSPGYGLARDRYPGNSEIASIAAVGFHLAVIPIGVERGWITRAEGYERVNKTLDTLLNLERTNGFYYHFVNLYTGKREWNSEVSIIDTGLLLAGAIVASEFFEGETKDKVQAIYDDINWNWYVNTSTKMFYMGYSPEKGFSGAWDHISEQLILYVLAAGSNTHSTGPYLYQQVKAVVNRSYTGTYTSEDDKLSVKTPFIYSHDGSLFQHQFSQAFIDFRSYDDAEGTNWFNNATLATKAAYAYAQDQSKNYQTYGKYSWGLTASDGPGEYHAYGSRPAKSNRHNGTIAPYGAIASINYLTKEAVEAANYYHKVENLWSDQYGFKDAYNLGPVDPNYNPTMAAKTPWVATDYIGIDKGITALMIANYQTSLIWNYFMKNYNVQSGLVNLGFVKK